VVVADWVMRGGRLVAAGGCSSTHSSTSGRYRATGMKQGQQAQATCLSEVLLQVGG